MIIGIDRWADRRKPPGFAESRIVSGDRQIA
jgi:hypothetical protein